MPESARKNAISTAVPLLAIAIIAALCFYPVLDGSLLLTERDLAVFFIPPRLLWTDAISSGEFPLWNPYYYSGHPLFATLQPGVLYPVNWLLLVLPFDLAFNWTIIAHFVMAGAFSWLLIREIGGGQGAAMAGALVFMLSGYLFSVHNVMSTLFSAAWMPLALYGYIRSVRGVSWGWAAFTGAVLALSFLGGGIEVLFAAISLLLAAALFPMILLLETYTSVARRMILLFAALVVFLSLSAVQLLPFLELAAHSTRSAGLSYAEATTWSLGLEELFGLFIPDPYGSAASAEKYWAMQSWLKTIYTGAIPVLLSVFFYARTGRRALPFALASIAFMVIAMGRNTPVYEYLFSYAPFIDKIRYPVKFLSVPFLFLAISAGLGLERLRDSLDGRFGHRTAKALLAAAVAAALAFGALNIFTPGIEVWLKSSGLDSPGYNSAAINLFNAKRVVFFLMLACLAPYSAWKAKRLAPLLPLLMVTILAADLFFAQSGYYKAATSDGYHAKGSVAGFLAGDREGPFRVFVTPLTREWKARDTLPGRVMPTIDLEKERLTGYNLEHGIYDVDGYEVMRRPEPTLALKLLSTQKGPEATSLLRLLNVKYVVSIPEIDSPLFVLRHESQLNMDGDTIKVYEYLGFLPRYHIVRDYKVALDGAAAAAIASPFFDPGATAVLGEAPAFVSTPSVLGEGDTVEVAGHSLNSVRLKVRASSEGLLVASESWYPGWKALIDGTETRLYRANYMQRAVVVPAGEHRVEFVYSPWTFKAGGMISASALILLAAFAVARRQR